jgi:hypothetical protein
MREGHYDTFDRAKFTFIESIYDGIGKADAAAEYYFASLNLQRHGYDLNNQDDTLLKMADIILKDNHDWFQEQFMSGSEIAQNPSLQPSRVVTPEPGQPFTGANIQMNPGDPNSDSHHDIDYFGSSLFPLHGDNMADHVANYYVGDTPGQSVSRDHADITNHFHRKHSQSGDAEYSPSAFLRNTANYGDLADDMTNHDIYERHFNDWKSNNDPVVSLMTQQMHEQGIFDDDEINHRLAIKHMEEAKEGWKDNLKFTDYLLGLEWTTPEERQKVYDHIARFGLTNKNNPLKLRSGNDWVPRIVQNIQNRFAPIFDHWVGKAHIPGFNTKAIREREPSAAREPGAVENMSAFGAVENGYKRALDYLQEMENIPEIDYSQRPYINYELSTDPNEPNKVVNRSIQFTPIQRAGQKTKVTDEAQILGHEMGMEFDTLLALIGADKNGRLHAPGQHPVYRDRWNPEEGPFSQEEVDKIMRERINRTRNIFAGKIGRREASIHYAPHIDEEDFDPEYTKGGTSNDSLATYWGKPFKVGGLNKNPQLLFELLHQATLLHGKNHFRTGIKGEEEELDVFEQAFAQMRAGEEKVGPYDEGYPADQVTMDNKGYEQSLFFMKNPNTGKLEHRRIHEDSDGGEHLTFNTKSAFAPFLPRPIEVVDSKYSDKPQVDFAHPEEPINIHSAGSANHLNKDVGTNNFFSRHAQSLNPAVTNLHLNEYEAAVDSPEATNKEQGDIRDKLEGKITGHFKTHNPFTFRGGHDPAAREKDAGKDAVLIAHHKHLAGPPGTPVEIGQVHDGHRPMNEDVYLPLTYGEGYVNRSRANKDRADNLKRQIEELENAASQEEGEASQIIENKLMDLEEQLSMIPTLEPKMFGDKMPEGTKMLLEKLEADDQAYEKLAKQKAAEFPELFDRSLPPDIIEGNLRQFARMLNDYLHQAPSEAHGLSSLTSRDEYDEKEMNENFNPIAEKAKDFAHNSDVVFSLQDFIRAGGDNNLDRYLGGLAEKLGMDPEDYHTQETMRHFYQDIISPYINDLQQQGLREELLNFSMPIQTIGNFAKHHFDTPDADFGATLEQMKKTRGFDNEDASNLITMVNNLRNALVPHRRGMGGAEKAGVDERNYQMGFDIHHAVNPDERVHDYFKEKLAALQELESKAFTGPKRNKVQNDIKNFKAKMINASLVLDKDTKRMLQDKHAEKYGESYRKGKHFASTSKSYRAQQTLDSLIYSDPFVEPGAAPAAVTARLSGRVTKPIEPVGPNAHNIVASTYNAPLYRMEFGHNAPITFDYKISKDGKIDIIPLPEPIRDRLVQPTMAIWRGAGLTDVLYGTDWEKYNIEEHFPAQFKHGRNETNTIAMSEDVNLATLTNPDIIRKEIGKGVPILQPMHRIFDLGDLEHLRGFTGDWIVSVMPEGERGFVKKEDDDVTSTNFTLSDEDKSNFKKVTDNDYHLDVFKTEEGYYIFDVLKYDDKEVHDVPIDDRIKILRGGLEGVENVHVPSASDTRLTDDAGLKVTVEDLQKENEKLLLRDAKSTYMAGELRHPKWVLLSPGNDVVLRVLERRGNGPYTYRLGTGPITKDEELGDRAVEADGEVYMDVGAAFDSDEKYNEGDHVRVNVSNVGESETAEGQKLFTVTGSKIEEEAEGEGLVSQETLGLLAKAEDSQWLCEVYRAGSGIRVVMPQGDVVYKCTQSGQSWTAHSPLASNGYLVRMSESQRPYWAPVAGALLKADVQIAAPAEEQEDKAEVHETEGQGKPLIPPKKIKDSEWWTKQEKEKVLVKGLQLVEKLLKSGVGAVGQSSSGTKGLGIDYATPIESPMGPTNLHDKKTMPDYDVRDMEEDSSIDEETEAKDKPKHMTVPTDEGVLEITEDSAVFRT